MFPVAIPGPPGIPGAPGIPGSSAILPFASGSPVILGTTSLGANTAGLIGFGNSAESLLLGGPTINLTGPAGGTLLNMAFSVPRAGFITSISAYFSTAVEVNIVGTTATITAQLYRASQTGPTPNLFTAIPGASVTLAPTFTGLISLGTSSQGSTPPGLAIPVAVGERLLMVFSIQGTGGTPIAVGVAGYASAGVAIS